MSKIIITTDWHLNESCIDELKEIIDEVYYEQDEKIVGTVIIGDLFDRKRPTPIEVEAMTNILCNLLKVMPVTIITGNHEELSNKISALDYTSHFGVKIERNKCIYNKDLQNFKILFGHFYTEETDEFARSNIKVKDLEQEANLVLLGHYHGFKKMGNYTYHLGSLRRVNFKEVDFGIPKYAIFDLQTHEIEFREVKSAIPMFEVDSLAKVATKPSRAKIRVVYKDFAKFKLEANQIPEVKKKVFELKIKLDFKNLVQTVASIEDTKSRSFEDIFDEFLHSEVEDKEVQTIIKECLK